METVAFKAGIHLLSLNPKIAPQKKHVDFSIPSNSMGRKCVSLRRESCFGQFYKRYRSADGRHTALGPPIFPTSIWTRTGCYAAPHALSIGTKDTELSTYEYDGFSVTTCGADDPTELKITVNVSGAKTEVIFDKVFSRMVEDAQPIPGFRRVKGGKTPNIPRNILLEILGYSKVYKQVIKKIINSTISEYVDKEGLAVSKDLRVEQSFEDLEAIFEPGEPFTYSAIIQHRNPK